MWRSPMIAFEKASGCYEKQGKETPFLYHNWGIALKFMESYFSREAMPLLMSLYRVGVFVLFVNTELHKPNHQQQ